MTDENTVNFQKTDFGHSDCESFAASKSSLFAKQRAREFSVSLTKRRFQDGFVSLNDPNPNTESILQVVGLLAVKSVRSLFCFPD